MWNSGDSHLLCAGPYGIMSVVAGIAKEYMMDSDAATKVSLKVAARIAAGVVRKILYPSDVEQVPVPVPHSPGRPRKGEGHSA